MRRSVVDGGFYSVMVGMGELYIPAFVLAVGLGEVFSGFVATLPQMVAGIVQMLAVRAVPLVGGAKRWSLICVGLQASSFIPLFVGALVGAIPAWAVFLSATVYWASGMSAGASWTTWISSLVPGRLDGRLRSRYFGIRQRSVQAGQLVGFIVGGALLQGVVWIAPPGQVSDARLLVFAAMFAGAGIARWISFSYLVKIHEPARPGHEDRRVSPLELVRRMLTKGGGRDAKLLVYMFLFSGAASLSAPFINPYILEQLHLSYGVYAALIGTVILGKMLSLPVWGALGQLIGARRLLWIGALGTIPPIAMFALSSDLRVLFVAQAMAGAAWGAYELASWLLQLEHLHERERTSLMATYFLGNTLAMGIGTLAGGALLGALGTGMEAYATLFWCSVALRLMTLFALPAVAGKVDLPRLAHAPALARRAYKLFQTLGPEIIRPR